MENKDLKLIKSEYGEDFAHLCRSLFPTLLEQEGKLYVRFVKENVLECVMQLFFPE